MQSKSSERRFCWSEDVWAKAVKIAYANEEEQNIDAVIGYATKLAGIKKSEVDASRQADFDDLASGKTNDFSIWFPHAVNIVKGGDGDKWRISGFCSSEKPDRQDETLVQKGLDFSEFLQFGYFNDNHQQHTAAVVGVPEIAELRAYRDGTPAWYTEGYLLKEVKRAQEIYTLSKALENTPRRLGFSVEGKVVLRDPMQSNRILKAKIRNVAVTNAPINTDATWSVVSKAFANFGADSAKSLMAGNALAATTGGGVVIPESIEGRMRDLGFAQADIREDGELIRIFSCGKCKKSFFNDDALSLHITKMHPMMKASPDSTPAAAVRKSDLDRAEAFQYIRRIRPEYSEATVRRFVDAVFKEE